MSCYAPHGDAWCLMWMRDPVPTVSASRHSFALTRVFLLARDSKRLEIIRGIVLDATDRPVEDARVRANFTGGFSGIAPSARTDTITVAKSDYAQNPAGRGFERRCLVTTTEHGRLALCLWLTGAATTQNGPVAQSCASRDTHHRDRIGTTIIVKVVGPSLWNRRRQRS